MAGQVNNPHPIPDQNIDPHLFVGAENIPVHDRYLARDNVSENYQNLMNHILHHLTQYQVSHYQAREYFARRIFLQNGWEIWVPSPLVRPVDTQMFCSNSPRQHLVSLGITQRDFYFISTRLLQAPTQDGHQARRYIIQDENKVGFWVSKRRSYYIWRHEDDRNVPGRATMGYPKVFNYE